MACAQRAARVPCVLARAPHALRRVHARRLRGAGAGVAKEQVEAALARRDDYSLVVVDDNLYYRR